MLSASSLVQHSILQHCPAIDQEHLLEVECDNQLSKAPYQAGFHSLQLSALPQILIKYYIITSAREFNSFPPKEGVSKSFTWTFTNSPGLPSRDVCILMTNKHLQAVKLHVPMTPLIFVHSQMSKEVMNYSTLPLDTYFLDALLCQHL